MIPSSFTYEGVQVGQGVGHPRALLGQRQSDGAGEPVLRLNQEDPPLARRWSIIAAMCFLSNILRASPSPIISSSIPTCIGYTPASILLV